MSQVLWKKNMECLRKRFPHIEAVLIKEPKETQKFVIGVQEVCEKRVLYAIKDEVVFQLDSLYESDSMLKIWSEGMDANWSLNAKLLLFGLGNGMYVREFLQHTSANHMVIVYEPSSVILRTVLQEFDLSDILADRRVILLLRDSMNKAIESYYYELLTFTDMSSFRYSNYLNYSQLFKEQYAEYMESIQNTCNGINSTQSVIGRLGKQYNDNTFSNLKYFINGKSLDSLYRNLPTEVPAIVVAAGPSLDKNIKMLHKAKKKALIIAVDSSLRPLLREGITPDLCVSVDGKKNFRHFSEEASKDIPLVCMLVSNNAVLAVHRAEKFFLNDLNHHIQHFLSQNKLVLPVTSTGGSVANDAFSLARLLGRKTIILVGQDLAYTGNKTHSGATVRGEWNQDVTKFTNNVWMEGIDGNPILSSSEFQLYRAWFEEQIINYPTLKVIDATEGGAKIKGSIIKTLEQAIAEECKEEFDFRLALEKTRDFLSKSEKSAFLSYINELPLEMEDCRQLAHEGCNYYDRMLSLIYRDKYRGNELKKLSRRTGEIGNILDERPAMEYIRNEIQQQTTEMLKSIYQTEADERKELITVCESGKEYLSLIESVLQHMIPSVKERLAEVKVETQKSYYGNRILIIKGHSANAVLRLVADRIADGYRRLGEVVKVLDLNEGTETDAEKMALFREIASNDNKLIVSMQALLFDAKYEGKSLMDYALCPVLGWIFDHPVCHLRRLMLPKGGNIHIACVDNFHVKFVERFFPNLKQVSFLPHEGFVNKSNNKKWEEREIELLFAGNNQDYHKSLSLLESLDSSLWELKDKILQKMTAQIEIPYEICLEECLKELSINYDSALFIKLLDAMYPVYRAVYEKGRYDCILSLLEAGCKVTVCGSGWDRLAEMYPENLSILREKTYLIEDVINLMGNTKFVLNVVPVFRAGAHERIFTAMLSGAICITDENEYVRSVLTDEEVIFYSMKELKLLPQKIKEMEKKPKEATQMAEKAYKKVCGTRTWEHVAGKILQLLNI